MTGFQLCMQAPPAEQLEDDAAKRAIGDHNLPSDCYATGPLTGDQHRDLVECPACTLLLAANEGA